MSAETNKEIVKRHLDLSWNQRDVESLDEVWAADAVIHLPGGMAVSGSDSIKSYLGAAVGVYSERELVLDDIVAEDNTVTTRWTFHGTQTGATLGVPPTNKRVTITGMDFYHLSSRKIVEEWIEFDLLGLMRQLGALK